jgi:hypothetical protein
MTKDDITLTIEAADNAFAELAKRRTKIEPPRNLLALLSKHEPKMRDSR